MAGETSTATLEPHERRVQDNLALMRGGGGMPHLLIVLHTLAILPTPSPGILEQE